MHINWAVTVVIIYYLPKKYVQHYKRNQNTCTRQLPSSGPSVGEEKQSQINESVHVINCSHNLI